jgi:hypothetical protein
MSHISPEAVRTYTCIQLCGLLVVTMETVTTEDLCKRPGRGFGVTEQSSPATRHGGPWGEKRYSSYSLLTSVLVGVSGQCHAPAALCHEERTPGNHWTRGWEGPRAGLDTEARGKIVCSRRGSNPGRPVVQPVVRHYTA